MASETTTLKDLFIEELRDIYHAEKQLVKALPKLSKASTSPDLREALQSHLAETEEQVSRLEQAFEMIDETPRTKVCEGMLGIVEEGSELIKENEKGPALDAAIIGAAQRSEHYEIATYGTLMAWAKALGHDDVAELLSASLDEEKAADEKLSSLAEAGLNDAATSGTEGEEADEAEEDEEERPAMAGAGTRNGGRGRSSSRKKGGR
jgi:ferritin-like metal-binding protein YciE